MIYNYGVIGFYAFEGVRQYDKSGNEKVLHFFENGDIPAFQIILPEAVSSASFEVLDIDGNSVYSGSITRESATNYAGTSYYRLIFTGGADAGNDDGYYYIKVTYNGSSYLWSDVFCWRTGLASMPEYLRVQASSSNIQIGEFEMNLSGFDFDVYLEAKGNVPEYELSEEGSEKTYGEVPLFNSRNKIVEFHVTGYRVTLDFLAGLRVLETNGNVTLTFGLEVFEVYNIENPEKVGDYTYGDIIITSLRAKRKDYLQSINEA